MERNISITLNAPRQKVWDILWGETTYLQWTAPFAEGSTAETDWKEGSKVLFLDGKAWAWFQKSKQADLQNTGPSSIWAL